MNFFKRNEKKKDKIKEFASLNSFFKHKYYFKYNLFITRQIQSQIQSQNQSQFNLKNVSNIIQNNLYNANNSNSQSQLKNKTAITLNPLQLLMNNEKLRQKIDSDLQEDGLQYPNLDKLSNPQKIEIKCKVSEKTKLKDQKVKVVIQNPKNSEKSLLSNQINHFI